MPYAIHQTPYMRPHTCRTSTLTFSRFLVSRAPSTHPLRAYCAAVAGYAVTTLVKVGASGKIKSNVTTSTLLWTVAGSIVNFMW